MHTRPADPAGLEVGHAHERADQPTCTHLQWGKAAQTEGQHIRQGTRGMTAGHACRIVLQGMLPYMALTQAGT